MQASVISLKTKKVLLGLLGLGLLYRGIISLLYHKREIWDFIESYLTVLGGIAYLILAYYMSDTYQSLRKIKLEPIVKIRLLIIVGIVSMAYLFVWLTQYHPA